MLDRALLNQLEDHFAAITTPVELVVFLAADERSDRLRTLATEIATTSAAISVVDGDGDDARATSEPVRRPSLLVQRAEDPDVAVSFAGLPLGHELTSLVLAVLQVGGHPPAIAPELAERIRTLDGPHRFETFFSTTCQNCPDVVQALNVMSVLNPRLRHVAVDGASFPDEVEARRVLAVPSVFLDGEAFDQGRMSLEQIVDRLDEGAAERTAAALDASEPYDVLVVGGGPAGVSAAVYAARKGIRTGVVAERLGGQVLDTLGIENFISVPRTEGPELGAALERHVKAHTVDVIERQRADALEPAGDAQHDADALHSVALASGATLTARTVVLAPGARWRQLGVPGEQEYRNKGVTYCPHCDGPLFAGKRVSVVGGGNSGVEAAIDLAGVVAHVTLLEFDHELRADAVLQRKLRSLPNATVVLGAETTEVLGDGTAVTALAYADRAGGEHHELALDGVFVQIGLLPNTEWLDGTVARNARGEIEIDDRGRTSVPGVFAAGDATTAPFKQIVVAMGAGSTAALAAFEHLLHRPADPQAPQPAPPAAPSPQQDSPRPHHSALAATEPVTR